MNQLLATTLIAITLLSSLPGTSAFDAPESLQEILKEKLGGKLLLNNDYLDSVKDVLGLSDDKEIEMPSAENETPKDFDANAFNEYINREEPDYKWENTNKTFHTALGATVHMLNVTSLKWLNESQ